MCVYVCTAVEQSGNKWSDVNACSKEQKTLSVVQNPGQVFLMILHTSLKIDSHIPNIL